MGLYIVLLSFMCYLCIFINSLKANVPEGTYLYQCGSKIIIQHCPNAEEKCSNVTDLQKLLIWGKLADKIGLNDSEVDGCVVSNGMNILSGLTFEKDGKPANGLKELPANVDKLFLISNLTIYEYEKIDRRFVRHGCIKSSDSVHYLYVSSAKVTRWLKTLKQTDNCFTYFAALKQLHPLDYSGRPPIILVPGFFSSIIDARFNKIPAEVYMPYSLCYRDKEDVRLWLNSLTFIIKTPSFFGSWGVDALVCWSYLASLVFNEATNRTENFPKVETRIPDFGGTYAVDNLDPDWGIGPAKKQTKYFTDIIDTAVNQWGYVKGENFHAAPYDFRKAPNEAEEYFFRLQTLIEETYERNGQRKVIFVGHSMGNLYLLYFLNHMSQEWKDKFIESWIAIAAPWGGSLMAMNIFIAGETSDVPVDPLRVRHAQRTFPSSTLLMPSKKFWSSDETLVVLNGKKFTVANYEEFFTELGLPDAWKMRQITENLLYDLKSPGVPVHCVIAYGKNTPKTYDYTYDDLENLDLFGQNKPTITYGPGDGIVSMRSAMGCMRWKNTLKTFRPVFIKAQHKHVLFDNYLLKYIYCVATGTYDECRKTETSTSDSS